MSVYAVFGSAAEAQSIARTVVEERLAACANILAPCHSVYRWEGAIQEDEEVPALFKTRADTAEALIGRIGELHSYDVPAAVVWPITGTVRAFIAWVSCETAG